jgi:hypothetical protein
VSLQGIVAILVRPEAVERVETAIGSLDETIKAIRAAIFALQSDFGEQGESLRAQVLAVADDMTPMLGFPLPCGWASALMSGSAVSRRSMRSRPSVKPCPTWPAMPGPAGWR